MWNPLKSFLKLCFFIGVYVMGVLPWHTHVAVGGQISVGSEYSEDYKNYIAKGKYIPDKYTRSKMFSKQSLRCNPAIQKTVVCES